MSRTVRTPHSNFDAMRLYPSPCSCNLRIISTSPSVNVARGWFSPRRSPGFNFRFSRIPTNSTPPILRIITCRFLPVAALQNFASSPRQCLGFTTPRHRTVAPQPPPTTLWGWGRGASSTECAPHHLHRGAKDGEEGATILFCFLCFFLCFCLFFLFVGFV